MTVRRGLLYFGVFLVAAGGVTLLASAGVLDRARIVELLAYWPIALVAIGVALVARRTAAALPAGIVAAAAPGILLGGMVVAVPDLPGPCSDELVGGGTPMTRQGSFGTTGSVDLELSCGELNVTTATGSGWTVDARNDGNREVDITAVGDRLAVASDEGRPHTGWRLGSQVLDVVLPTTSALDLDASINAGRGRLDLADARLGRLTLDVNAGDMTVDLGSATLRNLGLEINAGAATVHLPAAGGFTGDVEVNAGSVEICVPAGLAVRVTSSASLGAIDINGLTRSGDAWVAPGTDTTQSSATLAVSANVGSVAISSEGVCK
ncbi:MAG TPA: hypothetical protein VFY23_04780 [Candidatus Limnocylindrales bacterium]|nr:hypothetical protein [Candidatus Limnocylindrales bacterium]